MTDNIRTLTKIVNDNIDEDTYESLIKQHIANLGEFKKVKPRVVVVGCLYGEEDSFMALMGQCSKFELLGLIQFMQHYLLEIGMQEEDD